MNTPSIDQFAPDGQVALVTGAGRGIGEGIALALGAKGVRVGCFDLDERLAARTARLITDSGGSAIKLVGDVADGDAVGAAVAEIEDRLGPLDIGVNNAGIDNEARAEDMSAEQFRRLVDVNLTGVFICAQAEGRSMLARRKGVIVNIASMSGTIVNRGYDHVHYNSSKAAVAHLTKSLAVEWAARGVRVNAVSPGYVLTEMNAEPDVIPLHEAWISETPLARLAEVKDIVGPVLFLLSDAARYCAGTNLLVDGGFTCW